MPSQKNSTPLFSFEFFPPKSEDAANSLKNVQQKLSILNPDFFSVTFGAGGSTRDKTYDTVIDIQQSGIPAAPHLSCVASTKENIREILNAYKDNGVSKIVALRGDMPSGMMSAGEFRYANELVDFIRQETGDFFEIHVAAYPEVHPQAQNAKDDFKNFQRKVDAGANAVITQYFYNAESYFAFMDDCEKNNIDIPIVPGIMPITNYSQLARFSEMCGADIPRWMRKRLEGFGDDRTAIRAFGAEVMTKLCQQLLDNGAPGLHFYTMNQSIATLAIWDNLQLPTNK
ncbi:MAG: methylenetetrahydrofolate reductase [NAD(P)H] [Methylococcaceae bacterium]|nr:methylenetetrahydrofolate reductase [NAD(P)H] [Methylococcaceae bacterium]